MTFASNNKQKKNNFLKVVKAQKEAKIQNLNKFCKVVHSNDKPCFVTGLELEAVQKSQSLESQEARERKLFLENY